MDEKKILDYLDKETVLKEEFEKRLSELKKIEKQIIKLYNSFSEEWENTCSEKTSILIENDDKIIKVTKPVKPIVNEITVKFYNADIVKHKLVK